jgi:hypothetical protein
MRWFALVYFTKAVDPAKDSVHRFIYAFFKGFTLAELVARRSFPQHLVVYPQVYQHVDNRTS